MKLSDNFTFPALGFTYSESDNLYILHTNNYIYTLDINNDNSIGDMELLSHSMETAGTSTIYITQIPKTIKDFLDSYQNIIKTASYWQELTAYFTSLVRTTILDAIIAEL